MRTIDEHIQAAEDLLTRAENTVDRDMDGVYVRRAEAHIKLVRLKIETMPPIIGSPESAPAPGFRFATYVEIQNASPAFIRQSDIDKMYASGVYMLVKDDK